MNTGFSGHRLLGAPGLILALLLSACTAQPSGDANERGGHTVQSARKSGTGKVQHTLEPVTTRFPQLVTAESASWMSGTLGDSRAPGPSTYWIDAIVELSEAEHAEILRAVSATENPLPEDFSPVLRDAIPSGPLLTSSELNERFSDGQFVSKVYLVADGRSLILSTVFR
ncbi:hypothetical protein [Leifsonia shinshuensis]|uniref:Lipoprotein n=1 Tax=Leifsonia shinshuensis TaxID=150026 RepID=A0A7G6YAF5_9MICO|nr:hypothetical protein [Leifsonia shinshuensis]QNE35470.1 hypothetical protein F1C12_10260 [Leifsonia shinshuensis]